MRRAAAVAAHRSRRKVFLKLQERDAREWCSFIFSKDERSIHQVHRAAFFRRFLSEFFVGSIYRRRCIEDARKERRELNGFLCICGGSELLFL